MGDRLKIGGEAGPRSMSTLGMAEFLTFLFAQRPMRSNTPNLEAVPKRPAETHFRVHCYRKPLYAGQFVTRYLGFGI